jgi:hypothetical protein
VSSRKMSRGCFINASREGTALDVPKKPADRWASAPEETPCFHLYPFMRQVLATTILEETA